MTNNKLTPFHKSIALCIENAPEGPTNGRVPLLMGIIRMSDIPAGHDELISAIRSYFDCPGGEKWAGCIRVTIEHIEAERERHAKPSPADPPSIPHDVHDLDKLEQGLLINTSGKKRNVNHLREELEPGESFNQR